MEIIEFLKDVIAEIADSSGTWQPCEIVDAHTIPEDAERQDLVNCSYDHKFVEQHTGACEDDYYGSIWYPLGGGKYLRADFTC